MKSITYDSFFSEVIEQRFSKGVIKGVQIIKGTKLGSAVIKAGTEFGKEVLINKAIEAGTGVPAVATGLRLFKKGKIGKKAFDAIKGYWASR